MHDHHNGPTRPMHAAPTHDAAGHDRHAGHSVAMFRDRFWLSLALSVPVLVWSRDIQAWLGYVAPHFPGSSYVPAVVGTAVFLYGGLVFLRGAAAELRDRVPSPEEAVKPAAGLTTALLSIAIILYQQAQARSQKTAKRADKAVGRATDAVSELDLQKRLSSLKKRWDPSRLELEKISISRR